MTEASTARILRSPGLFGSLESYGAPGLVRRTWMRPARNGGGAQAWCCECVEEDLVHAWDQAAMPFVLRESEWRTCRSLPRAASRRRWLRGRLAAKDAVRCLMLERYGLVASLETIGVLPDDLGQPRVSCASLPGGGGEILVSISHCGNSSVALAAERSASCLAVGIDVALQAGDHEGLAEGGFAPHETALLEEWPAPLRADWLLRLWCAKEAAGKALGVGLMGNPLNYIVYRVNRARQTVEVEANFRGGSTALLDNRARVTAHVGADRGMAFAVVRLEEA